jgi:putative ABC transport system substrate-binding protein
MWYSTAGCIVMLTLSLLMAPLAARAQSPAKLPRIGWLGPHPPEPRLEVFKQGLRDLGWIEGQTIAFEYRWTTGHVDRLPALAAELVRLQVDLIVAVSTPAVRAAKDATTSIPIVIGAAVDPVRLGIVASLARPGGNITGTSHSQPELVGKQLEFLRTLLPTLSRVAYLRYSGGVAGRPGGVFTEATQDAAKRLGIQVQVVEIGSVDEMDSAFAAMSSERAEALVIQPLLIGAPLHQGQRIADLAVKHRLPTISSDSGFAEGGGLLSYGPDNLALVRSAAVFVDKILKGAKPGDLPVEQAMKFELVINLKTAKALALTILPILLFQADKVIQ